LAEQEVYLRQTIKIWSTLKYANTILTREDNMVKEMFVVTIAAAIIMVLAASGCKSDSSYSSGPSSNPPPPSTPNTVSMGGSAFSPASMTISKGTTVTWKNNDSMVHTSTSDTGVWDTGDIGQGESRTTTFNTAGTFKYHCSLHSYMTGTIVVQ